MALDMSDGGPGGWFGFSPAVIVVVVVVVLAGFGVFWKARGDVYVDAVAKVCEDSNAQVKADADARMRKPFTGLDYNDGIYQTFERGIGFRVQGLQAISASGEHADEHAALLAGEQRSLAMASGFAREIEQTRTTAGVMENTRTLIATMQEQDARYAALGAPGCSD